MVDFEYCKYCESIKCCEIYKEKSDTKEDKKIPKLRTHEQVWSEILQDKDTGVDKEYFDNMLKDAGADIWVPHEDARYLLINYDRLVDYLSGKRCNFAPIKGNNTLEIEE